VDLAAVGGSWEVAPLVGTKDLEVTVIGRRRRFLPIDLLLALKYLNEHESIYGRPV
jgi:hypothetical protein